MKTQNLPAAGLAAASLASGLPAMAQGIGVMVNGQPVSFVGAQPAQVEGRVMVPLRGVLEQMGATLIWDPATRTVVGSRENRRFELPIGSRTAMMNGQSMPLDVPAQIVRGTTMVPLRFVSEALGAEVKWRGSTQTVEISTDATFAGRPDDDLDRRDRLDRDDRDRPDRTGRADRVEGGDLRDREDRLDREERRRRRDANRLDRDERRDREDDRDISGLPLDANGNRVTLPNNGGNNAGGAAPVIQSFSHSASGPLKAGATIEAQMEGTPGGQAFFDVVGVATNVPMRETNPGHYTGSIAVPRGLNVSNARAFGRLMVRNQQAPLVQSGTPISIDAQPPQILNLTPAQGETVTQSRPDVYAEYRSEGSAGVDPATVQLLVNGKDVTGQARVTPGFVIYTPPADLNGPTTVQLRVADRAGNVQTASTKFTVKQEAQGVISVSHDAEKPIAPGETLTVTMKAEPGGQAVFDIPGVAEGNQGINMRETTPGTYVGTYTVKANDKAYNQPIRTRFISKSLKISRMNAAQPISLVGGKLTTPTILEPKAGEQLSGHVTIMGKAEPGANVRVVLSASGRLFGLLPIEGSNITQEVRAGADGTYKTDPLPLPRPAGARDLQYRVEAVTTDPLGRASEAAVQQFRAK